MLKNIYKYIYNLIPFKKQIFSLVKFLFNPGQKIYQHLAFKGVFQVKIKNTEFDMYHPGTLIENQLFWRGVDGFEPNSLRVWAVLCRDASVILDIGANTGVYTLIAKSQNIKSKVYSWEPVERVYEILNKNLHINHYDVNAYNAAVSNKDGISDFYDDDNPHTYSVTLNLDLSHDKKLHKVETKVIRLDNFIKANKIKSIDLIKIDVETHEPEVIEGLGIFLKQFRPTFVIEIIKKDVAISLHENFSGLKYNYFYINEPFGGVEEVVKGEAYQKVESLLEWKWGNYLICTDDIATKLNLI